MTTPPTQEPETSGLDGSIKFVRIDELEIRNWKSITVEEKVAEGSLESSLEYFIEKHAKHQFKALLSQIKAEITRLQSLPHTDMVGDEERQEGRFHALNQVLDYLTQLEEETK